jgi:hypothetical protein
MVVEMVAEKAIACVVGHKSMIGEPVPYIHSSRRESTPPNGDLVFLLRLREFLAITDLASGSKHRVEIKERIPLRDDPTLIRERAEL